MKNILYFSIIFFVSILPLRIYSQTIKPNWKSLAKNYKVPEWFLDGKIGIWMHCGILSSVKEDRPHDGSHYGRKMS